MKRFRRFPSARPFGAVALGAVLAAPLLAQAGDRKPEFPISLEEARAQAEARFQELDADGDGEISASEFAQAPMPRFHHRLEGKSYRAGSRADDRRRAPDTAERQARREASESELFARLDENGDGQLSQAEFSRERVREARQSMAREQMFQRLDDDGDGTLSRDELPDMVSRLEAMDADDDGQVTQDEARAYHRERRGDRG